MNEFLKSSAVIDWTTDAVRELADALWDQSEADTDLAQRTFEWVRDNIQHSLDHHRSELTCRASDVLSMGTGYCYAKSHLLAALLRANNMPAGFCYQRLTLDGDKPPFCLHGLNAVFLKDVGWYRIDPRGNKPGVEAQFTPPTERLAFSTSHDGEHDFPEIWSEPLPIVIQKLQSAQNVQTLATCLPDVSPDDMTKIVDSVSVQPILLS